MVIYNLYPIHLWYSLCSFYSTLHLLAFYSYFVNVPILFHLCCEESRRSLLLITGPVLKATSLSHPLQCCGGSISKRNFSSGLWFECSFLLKNISLQFQPWKFGWNCFYFFFHWWKWMSLQICFKVNLGLIINYDWLVVFWFVFTCKLRIKFLMVLMFSSLLY